MNTLFTIDLKNYNPEWKRSERPSVRAVIRADDDRLALVYAKKAGYYKFPGGGINADEDKIAALVREVREETGLAVLPQTVQAYGLVHRCQKSDMFPQTIFVQDSFYYFCDVSREGGGLTVHQQQLDDYEADAGFELRTVSIKDAVAANRAYCGTGASDFTMIARDTRVLEMLCGMEPEASCGIALKVVAADEIPLLHQMQIEAFSGLLQKYQDYDTNPGAEAVERIVQRYEQPWSQYYFIVDGTEKVGAIRIVDMRDGSRKRISPLWIMPEFRGRGYAQQAIRAAEKIYGADNWSLHTILQEKGNCHLYEKLGYHQTGECQKINECMDLVCYEKN